MSRKKKNMRRRNPRRTETGSGGVVFGRGGKQSQGSPRSLSSEIPRGQKVRVVTLNVGSMSGREGEGG